MHREANFNSTVTAYTSGVFAIILFCIFSSNATAAESDLEQWSVAFANHDYDGNWSNSLQLETRFSDNKNGLKEVIFKPSGYYRFNPTAQLGFGYKYQFKRDNPDEQDLWQEFHYRTPVGKYGINHQFRLEQRFIDNIDGMIPRVRYLIHTSIPLGAHRYIALSEAVRFNLTDKGEGPVDGFEQNRIYAGVGFRANRRLKLEVGYLWQYERQRIGPNESNHVLRMQFLIDSKGVHPPHGGS
jgi:hypothetical protein